MTQWYYADRNRQQQGPVEAPELARLYREGRVDDATLVWRDGLPQWESLSGHHHALGLAAAIPETPATVPAPAASASALELEPMTAAAPASAAPAADAWAAPAATPSSPAPEPAPDDRTAPAGPASAADAWTAPAETTPAADTWGPAAETAPASAPDAWTALAASTPAPTASTAPTGTAADPASWTVAAAEPAPAAAYSPYTAPASADNGAWSPQPAGEVVLAGFWKRVAAYLIDSLIVGVAGAVIGGVLGAVAGVALLSGSDAAGPAAVLLQVVIQLISLVVTAAYYAGFHASRGQATPGKMAIGIKVVRTDGSRISLLRGIGRYFAAILSGLILCIGYLMAAFTERKQGLHDMLCDTLVVDRWAYTDNPQWQRRELGTVTIVVLVLWGLLLVGLLVMMVALIGTLASMGSSW